MFAPIDRIVRVSLRQEALEVPPQDIITRDNVTLKVNAVIFLRVIDPNKAVVEVSNYVYQTSQFAQTTLRSVLGEQELDELLSHREKINLRLQSILDTHTSPWGVKVTNVEVKQVDMPESMLRAMAKQAEAEREKRSKIIHAEGEFSAAQRLVDAAHLLATEPVSVQLRYLADSDRDRRGEEYDGDLPGAGGLLLRAAEVVRKRRDGAGEDCVGEAVARRELAGVELWLRHKTRKSRWEQGKLLVLFFGLVGICALFFALGIFAGAKVGAGDHHGERGRRAADRSGRQQGEQRIRDHAPMTFYKSVEQKDANPELTPAADAKTDTAAAPATATLQRKPRRTLPIRRQPCLRRGIFRAGGRRQQTGRRGFAGGRAEEETVSGADRGSGPDGQAVSRAGGSVLRRQRRRGDAHEVDRGWVQSDSEEVVLIAVGERARLH